MRTTLLFLFATLASFHLYSQATQVIYPAALTNVEFRLGGGSLTPDFIGKSRNSDHGKYGGLGMSFQSNIFKNPPATNKFRNADFIGLGFNLGVGKAGLWTAGKMDLGWQFFYALDETVDLGIKAYATAIYDKISFTGVVLQPSVRFGRLYADFATGINVRLMSETI